MGVDSGLGTFRGVNSAVWQPLKAMCMDFPRMSTPHWFQNDPHLAWAFWAWRFKAYIAVAPHAGYAMLASWGQRRPRGFFSVTSNIDGHWERTLGPDSDRVWECHGALTRLQVVDSSSGKIWNACAEEFGRIEQPEWDLRAGEAVEAKLSHLGTWEEGYVVGTDGCSILDAKTGERCSVFGVRREGGGQDLMRILPSSSVPTGPGGAAARPNVVMHGNDANVNTEEMEAQRARFDSWLDTLSPASSRLAIVEIGAGTALPTIRVLAEQTLRRFACATLIRLNLEQPTAPFGCKDRCILLPLGALDGLSRINRRLDEADPVPGAQ